MTASLQHADRPRWHRPTPGSMIAALLAVEAGLWLSDRLGWWPKGYAVLAAVAVVGVAVLLLAAWYAAALASRLRFQFTIRSLLVLTVAVALSCSWLAVEMKNANRQREAGDAIVRMHGFLLYDFERDVPNGLLPDLPGPAPTWLWKWTGGEFFADIVFVHLDNGSEAGDAELHCLDALTELEILHIGGTEITDAGLNHITGLTRLRELHLWDTHVTDMGLGKLEQLNELRELDLTNTNVSDAGLTYLTELARLEHLDLTGTRVTDSGVERLQEALPNCKIEY